MPVTEPILCFGELLWDCLPHGRFPGGAPLNLAYHLHHRGHHPLLVSAVGDDPLGHELVQHLALWGLPSGAVARHRHRSTGTAALETGPGGESRYVVATDVAWDEIIVDHAILAAAHRANALIFGSLALRSPANQFALTRLLEALPPTAWRVFDVNLRAPHDELDLVFRQARGVSLLKLNAVEAARLAGDAFGVPGREEGHAREISLRTGATAVCVTAGARGAGLLRGDRWTWAAAPAVPVVDTVGAGEAFVAALVSGLIAGNGSDEACLAEACRLGSWVASQPGATPAYPSNRPAADIRRSAVA
ncbi:MAG TPA: PfkB family carbohydrate kinase [Opitutaceae bacterium]